ncbi:hypothetical protein FisN_16Lh130 [Fistulifera solaris]|uniref:Uncharacterized protein n=1 Tax=Fistulifera solaris TaxID=1519565 RepID=A0A1Z5KJ32_FISSO|nr:hypothetical protein FisN_16Lh130 [Fistulifera solaris]|eukprot:GAX26293.1 hypothetical protein FisN_16Lh130 [Fistulifera solaris]
MATTVSRLGRAAAVAGEEEKRSRCPSKRRGRRPSLRSSVGPETEAIPKNLMSSVDDEGSDDDEALLFNNNGSSNSRTSNGVHRRSFKHMNSPDGRQGMKNAQSAEAVLKSPEAGRSSRLKGSGNRRALNTDELRSPKSRALNSPIAEGTRSSKPRTTRSSSPLRNTSRRGTRTSHSGSAETKDRSPSRCEGRRSRGGHDTSSPQKKKPVTKIDDSDSENDGRPLSYMGGVHSRQSNKNSGLDDDVDFLSDYSSATEDESARGSEGNSRRERRKREGSRRQQRSSISGNSRRASRRSILPADDSEFGTEYADEDEAKHGRREKRNKPPSPSKHSSNQRGGRSKGGRPDALQFSPSNQRASHGDRLSEQRSLYRTPPSEDDTETDVDDTENAADDEPILAGASGRRRTRLSMDVLRADIQASESEGRKPIVDGKRIEADMADAMQRLEAHDAEASKKKKKGLGKLLSMFKRGDNSESGYESSASTSSARDPNRGLARHRSRLVKNVLPHTLLDDSESELQDVDLFLK